jgi:hypothetical protein
MVWASWINFLLGIWLIVARYNLHYAVASRAPGNDLVIGIVVAVCALISAVSGAIWASWVNLVLGIWLIIAGFALGFSGAAIGNDVVVGLVIAVLSAIRVFSGPRMVRPA